MDDNRREFGHDIARDRRWGDQTGKGQYKSHEQLAEDHRKMLMVISQDIRVILVKLADPVALAMRTLKHLHARTSKAFRVRPWRFMPLARNIGFSRWELEDSSPLFEETGNSTRFLT